MTQNTSFITANRIIREALFEAGLLQEGDEPSSELTARCINRLNDLINLLQTKSGLKLWTNTTVSIPLVVGKATYTIKPGGDVNMVKPMKIINAYYADSNGTSRSLDPPMSRDEYQRLSNKSQQGPITSYFEDRQQSYISITFWLTPDATAVAGTLNLTIQAQITNIETVIDTMNFPQEWFLPLLWGLADEMCRGQPQRIVDRCAQRAARYYEDLADWDVDGTSVSFTPGGYDGNA